MFTGRGCSSSAEMTDYKAKESEFCSLEDCEPTMLFFSFYNLFRIRKVITITDFKWLTITANIIIARKVSQAWYYQPDIPF